MLVAIELTIQALQAVVQHVPVGTNLALLHFLWTLLNGSFLRSRGAIFPALRDSGFSKEETRRSWAAMRYGAWNIDTLIRSWHDCVTQHGEWVPHIYEGYRPVAADLTAFWRPQLKGWLGKFFNRIANRALKGVGFGIVAQVGRVGSQRLPLLRGIVRAARPDSSEAELKRTTLRWVADHLAPDEVVVFDAGASPTDMYEAGIPRWVVRQALNCTARRNALPAYKGRGCRPKYGKKVRPLPRTWKDRTIPASKPDFTIAFVWKGRTVRVHGWHNLVMPHLKVGETHETFSILVFFDPLYHNPLVLATNVDLQPCSVFQMYLDRWPVEQVPLAAKQMLGLHRQFVFAVESCHRLPELALLAGNILTHLAAMLPPMPTGFWDRRPQRTPGRLRRVLGQADFSQVRLSDGQLRKKQVVTAHLPKGVAGHRRQKPAI